MDRVWRPWDGRAMIASAMRAARLAAASASLLIAPALAQSPPAQTAPGAPPAQAPADAPPVAVGPDWRYEKRPQDVFMFHCQSPRCVPPSRVSYRLYSPSTATTREQFRQEQETIVKALEQRAAPGTRIKILEMLGDDGTGPRRMFVSRRLITNPDGKEEYTSSALLLGTRYAASLISSSADEKASKDNHAMFALALMLFINVEPQAKQ